LNSLNIKLGKKLLPLETSVHLPLPTESIEEPEWTRNSIFSAVGAAIDDSVIVENAFNSISMAGRSPS